MQLQKVVDSKTLLPSFFLGFAQILLWGGSYFILPILSATIKSTFNWTETFVAACLSLSIFISGIVSPKVGSIIASNSKNYVFLFSGVVMAIGLLVLGFTSNKIVFVLAWILLGLAMGMGLYDALFASIGKKFGRNSSKYIVQITLISGFTTTVVWPFLNYLMQEFGWRNTCFIYSGLLLVVILPIHFKTLFYNENSNVVNDNQAKLIKTLPVIKKDKLYYLLVSNFSMGSFLMTAMYLYLLAILVDKSFTIEQALFAAAFLGPGQVSVRLIDTLIKQKPPVFKAIFSAVLIFLSFCILLLVPKLAFLGVFFFGFGNGLRSILRGTLPMKYYRKEAYPVAIGKLAKIPLIAQSLTPIVGGFIISNFSTNYFLIIILVLSFINILPPLILLYWKTHPDKINHDHVLYNTEH